MEVITMEPKPCCGIRPHGFEHARSVIVVAIRLFNPPQLNGRRLVENTIKSRWRPEYFQDGLPLPILVSRREPSSRRQPRAEDEISIVPPHARVGVPVETASVWPVHFVMSKPVKFPNPEILRGVEIDVSIVPVMRSLGSRSRSMISPDSVTASRGLACTSGSLSSEDAVPV